METLDPEIPNHLLATHKVMLSQHLSNDAEHLSQTSGIPQHLSQHLVTVLSRSVEVIVWSGLGQTFGDDSLRRNRTCLSQHLFRIDTVSKLSSTAGPWKARDLPIATSTERSQLHEISVRIVMPFDEASRLTYRSIYFTPSARSTGTQLHMYVK